MYLHENQHFSAPNSGRSIEGNISGHESLQYVKIEIKEVHPQE